jgi:glucokinase
MPNQSTIGIDLGGTNIRGGKVKANQLSAMLSRKINAQGAVEEVMLEIFAVADALIDGTVAAIGIGVPGLVDTERGLVFDVVKIPAWKEVPLRQRMEERYNIPVFIDNDANCFALGEFYFGHGKGCSSMLGLTIGTGLGSGIILQNKLYSGSNGGAGEFGMIDYLDQCYEYYASGQFFQNKYGINGETVFKMAKEGEARCLEMYEEMGAHLGNAIKAILYALDVELIVLGGSVRHAWPFFQKAMWQRIHTFAYRKAKERLRIEVSGLENSGMLGAAALYYDQYNKAPRL